MVRNPVGAGLSKQSLLGFHFTAFLSEYWLEADQFPLLKFICLPVHQRNWRNKEKGYHGLVLGCGWFGLY